MLTTTTQYQGVTRNTDKLIYRDAATNELHFRLSVEDRDAATRFLNAIKAGKREGVPPGRRPVREPDRRQPRFREEPEHVPDMLPDIGGPGRP